MAMLTRLRLSCGGATLGYALVGCFTNAQLWQFAGAAVEFVLSFRSLA